MSLSLQSGVFPLIIPGAILDLSLLADSREGMGTVTAHLSGHHIWGQNQNQTVLLGRQLVSQHSEGTGSHFSCQPAHTGSGQLQVISSDPAGTPQQPLEPTTSQRHRLLPSPYSHTISFPAPPGRHTNTSYSSTDTDIYSPHSFQRSLKREDLQANEGFPLESGV